LGQYDEIVTAHMMYTKLGENDSLRQSQYRHLFDSQISELSLDEMREATNKGWVMGSDYFKEKIAKQLNRRVKKLAKGGDRKSDEYNRNKGINRV